MQSASKRENSRGGEEEEKGVASLFVKKAKVRLNQQWSESRNATEIQRNLTEAPHHHRHTTENQY